MAEDRNGVWISELNAPPGIHAQFQNAGPVKFYDTTLRDGEQSAGIVLPPQQKLEIARSLDALGVGRIEAGFPRVSPDDAEAFKRIANAGLKAEIWGFARAVRADVDELLQLGARAAVIESPTSVIKLKAYGISAKEARRRVTDAVGYARSQGLRVAYFPVDGTRTELNTLKTFYRAALDAGAEELVVVDTIGACGPEAVEFLVRQVHQWFGPKVPCTFTGTTISGWRRPARLRRGSAERSGFQEPSTALGS